MLVATFGALVVLVIVGLTGLGLYLAGRGPADAVALEVGGARFTTEYVMHRMRMLVAEGNQLPPNIALGLTIQNIADEEIMRQRASTMGVATTSEELEQEISQQVGIPLTDKTAYLIAYQQELRKTRLPEQQYNRMIEARVLERKLQAKFRQEAPPMVDQVQVRLILVRTPEEAQSVLRRLEDGEDFADLARELSQDFLSKGRGGQREWIARGLMGDAFDAAVFALEPGQRSGPISTDQGVSIVEVQDKATNRELTEEQRNSLGDRAFTQWRNQGRTDTSVVSRLDTEKLNWILQRAMPEPESSNRRG